MRFWLKGIIVACALGFAGTCALVQASAPDFYRGKTVRIFIGFGPGGCSSLYGDHGRYP